MKKIFSLPRFQVLLVFALSITALIGGGSYQKVSGSSLSEQYQCNGEMMTEDELLAHRNISRDTMQLLSAKAVLQFSELCGISDSGLTQALIDLGYVDIVETSNEFRNLRLADKNGEISMDAYLQAQRQLERMQMQQGPIMAVAGIDKASWNWIGPGNIGGRIRALAVHPADSNTMWVGAISGGIWKTTNGGVSWQIQDDFMANMAVTSIIIDPDDANTLYAGTGEVFGYSQEHEGLHGAWIFKTENGGETWNRLPSAQGDAWYDTLYVSRLAISKDGNTLLAATEDGIFRSTNAGTSWTVSSINGGGTWTWLNRPLDVDFDLLDTSATPNAVASGVAGTIWHSTDGGASWTSVALAGAPEGIGRVEIAYASNVETPN